MLPLNSFHHSNCFRERCRYVFVLLAPSVKEMLEPSEFPQSLCYFFGGLMNQGNMGQFQKEDRSSLGQGTENASLASVSKQWPRTGKRMRHFPELLNCRASSSISTEEITTRPLSFMMLPRKAAWAQAAEHPDTICLVCTTVTLTTQFWMLWKHLLILPTPKYCCQSHRPGTQCIGVLLDIVKR